MLADATDGNVVERQRWRAYRVNESGAGAALVVVGAGHGRCFSTGGHEVDGFEQRQIASAEAFASKSKGGAA